ncbi:MAG: nitrogenase component 1 [Lachnospiraceae bacterium]
MPKYIEQPRYSCAVGAMQSVVAIRRGVPILHSGPGCANKITSLIGQGEGYAGGSTIPCTNAEEKDVVFGGEKKLTDLIESSLKVIDADLYVVLTGCTSAIVGDDVASVVSEFQDNEQPVVAVDTAGFRGNNHVGHAQVVNAIIDQYVERHRGPVEVEKGLVNLFASVPYQDPYWNGNIEELKKILEAIGLKVNALFGHESGGVEEWKTIPNAEFNIVAGAWSSLPIAKHLEKKYKTPYLHFPYLPIGGIETSRFLREVAVFGKLDTQLVEAYIQREEEKYYSYIEQTADFMLEFRYGIPRRVYAIAEASYVLGFSKFLLNELGIIPGKQFIVDDTPEKYQAKIREEFKNISEYKARNVEVEFNPDAGESALEIERLIKGHPEKRSLILGSGWDKSIADATKSDLLIISPPVTYRLVLSCGYTGYTGGLRAIEDIYDRVLGTYR